MGGTQGAITPLCAQKQTQILSELSISEGSDQSMNLTDQQRDKTVQFTEPPVQNG
tara:strand:+ start:1271 stop:1435 length:165 start_codon:yes stop_codon:yes gene_type:complete